MIRKIMTEIDVKLGVKTILSRIDEAYNRRSKDIIGNKPILVAVSKTKPVEMIVDAYSGGQRHFGENYVQELIDKGSNSLILENCRDIKWHFIGHLQRNKIKKVLNTPGLYMIETVDSIKLAESLDLAWAKLFDNNIEPLKILLQINTSGEMDKSGIDPADLFNLYRHISKNCINLKIEGLMTIGKFGHDYTTGPNEDFITLVNCQKKLCDEFKLKVENIQLSMGMSDDFEQAIEMGSTIVRVGSSIFGYRPKPNEDDSKSPEPVA